MTNGESSRHQFGNLSRRTRIHRVDILWQTQHTCCKTKELLLLRTVNKQFLEYLLCTRLSNQLPFPAFRSICVYISFTYAACNSSAYIVQIDMIISQRWIGKDVDGSDRDVPMRQCTRAVFLNRRAAARYRALASIIPGRERPVETTICYKISLVQLIINLNVILYLSTYHTIYVSVLLLFMIMP